MEDPDRPGDHACPHTLVTSIPDGIHKHKHTHNVNRWIEAKGTDLSTWSSEEIEAVAHALNSRPRKTLGWKTPAEAFNEQLLLLQQAGVASTG